VTDLTFLSHIARGFNAVADVTGADGQLTIPATLRVTALPSGEQHTIHKSIRLHRPCDVVGIEPGAIYRTDPDHRVNATEFEPNYLAAVELAASDLPWRFSPERGHAGRRKPWLTLIVLADGEYEYRRPSGDIRDTLRPHFIRVFEPARVLPPSDQLGAWAHAQAIGRLNATTPAGLSALDQSDLAAVRSRLLAPRRLLPITRYLACLVPTFECGRTRGLDPTGEHEHTPGLSWSSATTTPLDLPVYFSWSFTTAARGDIEALAKRLTPGVLRSTIGTRPLHVGDQDYGIPGFAEPLHYAGALVSTHQPHRQTQPQETTDRLIRVLNAPASLRSGGQTDEIGLPALAPPIYGQWHRPQHEIDPADPRATWVAQLNSDIAHRSAAGLGAEIVRRHQEELVAEAWRQVGDVIRATRRIAAAEFGLLTAGSLHRRAVRRFTDGDVVMLSRPVHAKLRTPGHNTLLADLQRSTLRGVAASARVRSAIAPTGASRRVFARTTVEVDPAHALSALARSTSIKADFEAGITDPALRVFVAETDDSAHVDVPSVDLAAVATEIRAAVSPDATIPARVDATIDGIQIASAGSLVSPVMPAPEFDTPMYGTLRDLGVAHLLPGIDEIPPNTALLLRSNQVFIETFMTGLNHEMAAELLWRGYPATDLRATYFRYFWESDGEFPDIRPLHTWDGALGENGQPRAALVLLIHGDLIRRFPGVIIYAQQAAFEDDAYRLAERVAEPIFRGDLTPDTVVVGFDLEENAARGFIPPSGATATDHRAQTEAQPGYFFVLEEQPREPRFGLDEPVHGSARSGNPGDPWQAISWADVTPANHNEPELWNGPIDLTTPTTNANLPTDPPWNGSAADLARAMFRQPYRLAIHAQRLLHQPGEAGGGL
jgi:hypothetical protein